MAFICCGKQQDQQAGACALSPWTRRLGPRTTGVFPIASVALGQASVDAPFFLTANYYKIILYPKMKAGEDTCFQFLLILSSILMTFVLIRHERDLCLYSAAMLTVFPGRQVEHKYSVLCQVT